MNFWGICAILFVIVIGGLLALMVSPGNDLKEVDDAIHRNKTKRKS